jgi:hypothetical protein
MVNRKVLAFVSLAIVFIFLAVFMAFFVSPSCEDFTCFRKAMEKCDKTKYLNDEPEATWRYEILGSVDNKCDVKVTLLQPKAGELGIEKLIGNDMICSYPKGIAVYPEKDLERCHGRLKEELQSMVIRRLHRYLIENLGEVDQSLEFFSDR